MRVRVLFFGMLRDLAGQGSQWLELSEGAVLGDVLRDLRARTPGLEKMIPSLAMALNEQYAAADSRLKEGDEVALLPPVSGGSTGQGSSRIAIIRDKIDTQALLASLKDSSDGAAVLFEGVVRNNTRGRKTLFLEYEAYEGMALRQMDELARQALAQFPIRDVGIVHRLGRLEIGETSVAIAVASAHRAAAFEACRWLIDTLKRTVPIWKKEYFEDGAVWADGEPFPAEIAVAEGSHPAKLASK